MTLLSRIGKLEAKLKPQKPEIYWLMWLDCQWHEAEGVISNKSESTEEFKKECLR